MSFSYLIYPFSQFIDRVDSQVAESEIFNKHIYTPIKPRLKYSVILNLQRIGVKKAKVSILRVRTTRISKFKDKVKGVGSLKYPRPKTKLSRASH
jgi:hypothetical protein